MQETLNTEKRTTVSTDPLLKYWQSAELLFASKEFFLAKSLYTKIHELDPKRGQVLERLAFCFQQLGELENARVCFEQVCQIHPGFQSFVEAGNFFYEIRDFENARKSFLKAICYQTEDYKLSFDMFKNLGNIAVNESDFDQAIEYYNKAHRIFDGSDVLMVNYGSLYFRMGKWDSSFKNYREALELNPRSDKAYFGLAILYREQQENELAVGSLHKALDIAPFDKLLLKISAQWALEDFSYSAATRYLEAFIESHEFDSEINILLACLMYQSGQIDACYWEACKILAFDPQNEDAEKLINLTKDKKRG